MVQEVITFYRRLNFLYSNGQVKKFKALDAWFKTPQGFRVAEAFTNELIKATPMLDGSRLLQLGGGGNNLWLPKLNYRQKWIASQPQSTKNPCF